LVGVPPAHSAPKDSTGCEDRPPCASRPSAQARGVEAAPKKEHQAVEAGLETGVERAGGVTAVAAPKDGERASPVGDVADG